MANIKASFVAAVSFTVTNLQSLAAAAAWQSDVVNNSANLYLDELVELEIHMGTGTSGADKGLTVYAYASIDAATTYTESASGSEGSYTMATDRQLRPIGFIPATVTSATLKAGPFSVAAAFGGVLPERWGIVVYNNTGIALSTGNVIKHQGVYATST